MHVSIDWCLEPMIQKAARPEACSHYYRPINTTTRLRFPRAFLPRSAHRCCRISLESDAERTDLDASLVWTHLRQSGAKPLEVPRRRIFHQFMWFVHIGFITWNEDRCRGVLSRQPYPHQRYRSIIVSRPKDSYGCYVRILRIRDRAHDHVWSAGTTWVC